MAERRVTQSKKDSDGNITVLCNPGTSWSPRWKANAIRDIENGTHSYYVLQSGGTRAAVEVRDDKGKGKYLRTVPDETIDNNLDDLPDC